MARLSTTDKGRVLITRAYYLEDAMDDPIALIHQLEEDLSSFEAPDTLIGRGLSGALFVPMLADALGLHWAVVRKKGDGSHSHEPIEGTIGERWLFVDDLIASGSTLAITRQAVHAHCKKYGHETEFVGAWTYAPRVCRTLCDLPSFVPEEAEVASLATEEQTTPAPRATRNGKGSGDWAALNRAIDAMTKDLAGFPSLSEQAGKYLKVASELPCINDLYAELKKQQPRVEAPKPYIPRGGKARRQLQALEAMTEARAFAMQQVRDTFTKNQRSKA